MVKTIIKVTIRILLVSLYAILVVRLVGFTMPDDITFTPPLPKFALLFIYLTFFNLNTEGNLFFDYLLNRKLPWFTNPYKRLIVQIGIVITWSLITIALPFTFWYYYNGQSLIYPPTSVIIFIGSIVFLFGFIGISMTINFFNQWKQSLLAAEHYKHEKLKADYKVLQNQVNPHFLFNSLNVLISEIKHNPESAELYTRKLSKVYRYVLQSTHHDLIPLSKELEFIDSFIFLHKVSIGDALNFSTNISDGCLVKQIPPLTLQILIENAIKHNIANMENILNITIETVSDDKLVVRNSLQIIRNTESTNTGLSNLTNRFSLLNRGEIRIQSTDTEFIVTVPLIEEEYGN